MNCKNSELDEIITVYCEGLFRSGVSLRQVGARQRERERWV